MPHSSINKHKSLVVFVFLLALQAIPSLAAAQQTTSSGIVSQGMHNDSPVPPAAASEEQFDGRALVERLREARRQDPGNPYAGLTDPGLKFYNGLDAPESEAIRVLFSDIEQYKDLVSGSDLSQIENARLTLNQRNYDTPEVIEFCSYLLSLNGRYDDGQSLALRVADQLAAGDAAEAADLRRAYYTLLPNLSPEGRRFFATAKSRVHSRISSTMQDWHYAALNNTEFLIERRERFCLKI